MKRNIFIATIQIAFEAQNNGEACDAVSAMFTENLQQNNAILDWRYKPENGVYPDPEYLGTHDLSLMEENEIFNLTDDKLEVYNPDFSKQD